MIIIYNRSQIWQEQFQNNRMFTRIIKELLRTEITNYKCNEMYSNINNDDEYESSNIASEKESGSISGNFNLDHTKYSYSFMQLLNKLQTLRCH